MSDRILGVDAWTGKIMRECDITPYFSHDIIQSGFVVWGAEGGLCRQFPEGVLEYRYGKQVGRRRVQSMDAALRKMRSYENMARSKQVGRRPLP
jgi:hypothetical protein